MPEVKKSFHKPSIKEIRISGKETDIQYLFTTHIDRILSLGSRDLFNSEDNLNSYEGAVENLIATLTPSADLRFYLDLDASNEFELETTWDKINKVRDRFSMGIEFMSRRGFWPAGDVESAPLLLIDHIQHRVKRKLDSLIGVEGERGSGKSYTTLWLCYAVDKTFNNNRIFFNGEDFRQMLDKEHYPPGTAFMWDEATAGKGLNKYRSMSTENLDINNILQVIRKRRYIVFFTQPSVDVIQKESLDYFGGKITPITIDEKASICYVKFYEKHGAGDHITWRFLRTPTNHRITSIPIPKISKDIADDYEARKDAFLAGIIKKKRKRKGGKKIPDLVGFSEYLQPNLENLRNNRGNFKIESIQTEYLEKTGEHLGRGYAAQVVELLKKNEKKEADQTAETERQT